MKIRALRDGLEWDITTKWFIFDANTKEFCYRSEFDKEVSVLTNVTEIEVCDVLQPNKTGNVP